MKATLNSLLIGIVTVFCCSIGSAQIIYSNNFALGGTGNISNTPPTVANSYAGGTNAATWNDVIGINNSGSLLANGTDNTATSDSWLLPFVPQSNHIYLLSGTVTFSANPGSWVALGFAQNNPTNVAITTARFADAGINGYDFIILTAPGANEQWFSGPRATPAAGLASANVVNALGTWTIQIILNTLGSQWTAACFVNGTPFGTNFTFTSNPPIGSVGISQTTLSNPSGVQWNNFSLISALQPFITQQPVSPLTVNGGTAFTTKVTVAADTNGGPLYYQWYFNDVPLTNGVGISGADTNVLMLNPVIPTNGNYYVIVTNNYGSVTSTVASVTVLTTPKITSPSSPTNLVTLFAGTASFVGSSPTFSVTALGAPPFSYYWQTNGVTVVGATNSSFTITNCQIDSPTNFTCIVSNTFGEATNIWIATYIATPTAPYPQAVLTSQPLDFWRLNEPDNGLSNGNTNIVANDYESGNNGVYTNVNLGSTGYNPAESAETAPTFGPHGINNSYAGGIQQVDFAVTNGANAEFTVEAWANGSGPAGAPIITKGTYNVNDAFALDLDSTAQNNFQFSVRTANGTVYTADSAISPGDGNWHHVIGVCDELHSNISLYVDGALVGSTNSAGLFHAGAYETTAPVSIGATTQASVAGYSLQFFGFIDDVAVYNRALSAGEAVGHYGTLNPVPLSLFPQPPANLIYQTGGILTIPATVLGPPPLGYYWTNITTGGLLSSGTTNALEKLDATLTIPNVPGSLDGNQLELVITNSNNSLNAFVNLSTPAPPVALDYSESILYSNYFNGGTWSIAGTVPTAVNNLVGGTNIAWVDALGTNDTGALQASGIDMTLLPDSWLLPFTPHAGYVYTISATLTFNGDPGGSGDWVGLGFAGRIPTNAIVSQGRFSDDGGVGPKGYNWMILTESTGNLQYFVGPTGTGQITNKSPFFAAGTGTHNIQIVLDTTGTSWKGYAYVDGVSAGTNVYSAAPTGAATNNPPVGAIGITQTTLANNGRVQWNSFSLSQVAPGGVPPYLLNSVPTNVTLLSDASLSISASEFGSAPFGYYWSNTNSATVLGSGASTDITPLSANISIPDVPSTWNGNTLALTLTNAYGTNISFVTLTVSNPVNASRTNIVVATTNSNIYLSWPADHTGWTLQVQTNSLTGIWFDVAGSKLTNQIVAPINTTNQSVFFRMILK
jgi:hypothetical protein